MQFVVEQQSRFNLSEVASLDVELSPQRDLAAARGGVVTVVGDLHKVILKVKHTDDKKRALLLHRRAHTSSSQGKLVIVTLIGSAIAITLKEKNRATRKVNSLNIPHEGHKFTCLLSG